MLSSLKENSPVPVGYREFSEDNPQLNGIIEFLASFAEGLNRQL